MDSGQFREVYRDVDDVNTSATGPDGSKVSKISVAVRKRPRNNKEKMRGEADIAEVNNRGEQSVTVHEPKQKVPRPRPCRVSFFVCFCFLFDSSRFLPFLFPFSQ